MADCAPADAPPAPTLPQSAPLPMPAVQPAPQSTLPPQAAALLDLHNQARARAGAPPLALDESLCAEALQSAAYQVLIRRGGHWLSIAGGENCAQGQRDGPEAVACWLSSPGHARTLLDRRWTRVGFAAVEGPLGFDSRNGVYWVARFR